MNTAHMNIEYRAHNYRENAYRSDGLSDILSSSLSGMGWLRLVGSLKS